MGTLNSLQCNTLLSAGRIQGTIFMSGERNELYKIQEAFNRGNV